MTTMKIIKGQLHLESWPERYQYSKGFPAGTLFTSEQWNKPVGLFAWSALDAQPCLSLTDAGDDDPVPSELTLTTADGRTMTVIGITDISNYITELDKKRNISEVIRNTGGYIALE